MISPTALTIIITWDDYENCSKLKQWPGYTPQPNGCSTPTGNNPTGCDNTSFLEACNTHDRGYQSCHPDDKDSIDDTFKTNMLNVCYNLIEDPGSCTQYPDPYRRCSRFAEDYHYGVSQFGQGYWEDDQVAACTCCDC